MTLLNKRYLKIHPTQEYLADKVLLAQAWKKAHQHIRSTNWYADTFELDCSAIHLDKTLNDWRAWILSDNLELSPLMLVPAPKSSPWHFKQLEKKSPFGAVDETTLEELQPDDHRYSHQWEPEGEEPKALRPLAHIHIREQTLFTALMCCLANQVETLQGNTDRELDLVHQERHRVVSYGNRLYCNYVDDKAHFNWGNSTTYSKYFKDYQAFLERPTYFGNRARQLVGNNEQVYEVELDISKFFDRVKRDLLIEKIREIASGSDLVLERLLQAFENWSWEDGSAAIYKEVCSTPNDDSPLPQGIPQGLVAGGFLANIYLLDFDREIAELIDGTINDSSFTLVDYCRYVDDMRLIVIGPKAQKAELRELVESFAQEKLQPLNLELNSEKTRVEVFRNQRTGISARLKEIQQKVSGPMSLNDVDEQLGHLEGIIALAGHLDSAKNNDNTNPLAQIDSPLIDVRSDTLMRFSANKIHRLLKQKRSLYAQEVNEEGNPIPGSWDFLQEQMARRFISSWSKDPALVLLLKKSLELFPDLRTLKPVVEQLELLMANPKPKLQAIASYCFCEIFRHAATEIHNKNRWAIPAHANLEGFFEYLQTVAADFSDSIGVSNNYLAKQAQFFLLIRNDSLLGKKSGDRLVNLIGRLTRGFRNISCRLSIDELLSATLLASQIAQDRQSLLRALTALMDKACNTVFNKQGYLTYLSISPFAKQLATESIELFEELYRHGRNIEARWTKCLSGADWFDELDLKQPSHPGELAFYDGKDASLLNIIRRSDNPFSQEISILKLLAKLLEHDDLAELLNKGLSLSQTKVTCANWNEVQLPDTELKVAPKTLQTSLFDFPDWIQHEHKPLYALGMFIRSCLLGKLDWSLMENFFSSESGYKGLKTSFYKRQLGMFHSPEALGGIKASSTNWISGLLYRLLQWPGLTVSNDECYNWPTSWDLSTLAKCVDDRLQYLRRFFCYSSGIPAYVERIKTNWDKDKKHLNVVMVQSLLPKQEDFSVFGLKLDAADYRARHRRHVAAVSELLLHKAYGHTSIDDDLHNKKLNIDLIIWPELAVHQDDVDILERLSDKTSAIIFTGLNFINQAHVAGPNNVAQWIIPKHSDNGRQFIKRLQGKENMTALEREANVTPWRPYQLMIELMHPAFPNEEGFILTGSICYDATDIKMSSDLKGKSHSYIVSALNKDVATFDSMVDALYYHMYQHVTLVNTGEFGGSVAKAPYKERYDKLITHVHGAHQVSISCFEMNMFDFREFGASLRSGKQTKTKPAG